MTRKGLVDCRRRRHSCGRVYAMLQQAHSHTESHAIMELAGGAVQLKQDQCMLRFALTHPLSVFLKLSDLFAVHFAQIEAAPNGKPEQPEQPERVLRINERKSEILLSDVQ